ncbi:MAG: integrase/recombinase XerD [Saprospiraceae bacterium]|jgi:site-specific recombinase XerD
MSKPIAIISPLQHNGAAQIKVNIPNEAYAKSLINQIKERRWSATHTSWYVPKTEANFQKLKELFDVKIQEGLVLKKDNLNEAATVILQEKTLPQNNASESVIVEKEHDYRVKVFIPRHRKDWIEKIKSLPNRAWNQEQHYWSIPKTTDVLAAIQQLFGADLKIADAIEWKTSKPQHLTKEQALFDNTFKQGNAEDVVKKASQNFHVPIPAEVNIKEIHQNGYVQKVVYGDKIVLCPINKQWIAAFVPGDKKGWVEVVKNIPGRRWNVESRCWCVPYVKDSILLLKKHISVEKLIILFKINESIPAAFMQPKTTNNKKVKESRLNKMQQLAVTALEEKLILEGKMYKTIKSYKYQLTNFILFYRDLKPSSISLKQIERYIIMRRKQDNVSDSNLNQFINAINAFYVRVLKQEDKVATIERPPKRKKLPNVFSEEEVQQILKSCDNIKHKCMLILTYSAGLRKQEVLNLQVRDLHFDRKTLFVRNGKGGKDRYTFFSKIAIKYIREYLQEYNPSIWLFEGQTGGQYSPSSIQSVFEKARKKCDANPYVTLHGLRHSFATHLVEKGVPLHVVQELLGHGSIKTTEIYLHISNKYRKELKSPLDDMDI